MSVKKAFQPLHTFLLANLESKVGDIMEEITDFASAKGAGGGSASHRNEDGEVVAILDYYFKKWLPVQFVEFGAKANSNTGLNTMCKLGVSHWTKAQRTYKLGKEQLLDDVAAQIVEPTEIQEKLDGLEAARTEVVDYPVPQLAFNSLEDLLAAKTKDMQTALDKWLKAEEAAAAAAAKAEEAEEARKAA